MPRLRILAVLATLYFAPFLVLWPTLFGRPAAALTSAGNAAGDASTEALVLVDASEPGEPMVIDGRLFAEDGETPLAGAEIYVYHTDINGYYSGTTTRSDDPRIRGTLTTDGTGRFSIRTIRPGPYPAAGVPAHIHFVVRAEGYDEQRFELRFGGDPLLSSRQIEASKRQGRFATIRDLTRDSEGTWHCVHQMRLRR